MAENSRFDAIIVGSGLGGSSLAYRLATRGQRVLVVERGDFLRPGIVEPGQPIGKYIYHVVKPGQPLAFVGGATKFYGAALYRLHEMDFVETAHEAGTSPAWPISYADLEPYYAEGEKLFRVHGDATGDRSAPPRSGPFPHRPVPNDPIIEKLARSLERTGTPGRIHPQGAGSGRARCVPHVRHVRWLFLPGRRQDGRRNRGVASGACDRPGNAAHEYDLRAHPDEPCGHRGRGRRVAGRGPRAEILVARRLGQLRHPWKCAALAEVAKFGASRGPGQ